MYIAAFFRQTWNFFERIAEECAFVSQCTSDRYGMDATEAIAEEPFDLWYVSCFWKIVLKLSGFLKQPCLSSLQ